MDNRPGIALDELVLSELNRTAHNIANNIEEQEGNVQKETDKQKQEIEHIAETSLQLTKIVTSGWTRNGVERAKTWEIEY
jgi:flagellar motility protein MotE (MotC chaperone)